MHSCLEVPEIVLEICEAALGNRDKASVASLARTCASFYEPAMTTLWRNLDSLVPLFLCLPRETWGRDPEHGGLVRALIPLFSADIHAVGQTYNLRYVLKDSDWDRFLRNASRVRTLCVFDDDAHVALQVFAFCCPHKEAFHSLIDLYWSPLDSGLLYMPLYVVPLLGSNITRLKFELDDDLFNAAHLHMAQTRCPGLRHLEVLTPRLQDATLQGALDCSLISFPDLQSLKCANYEPTYDALLRISCSQTLRTLEIALTSATLHRCVVADPEMHDFPLLEELTISSVDKLPTRLLQAPKFPHLRHLDVTCNHVQASTFDLQQFITAVSCHKTLDSFHLRNYHDLSFPSDPLSIAPLMDLPHLKVLVVYNISFTLPVDYTQKMIAAWPKMEHLELFIPGFVTNLWALRAFARGWPRLNALLVDYDASDAALEADRQVMSGKATYRSRCKELREGHGLQSAVMMAATLSDTFSRVRFMEALLPPSDVSPWRIVEPLLAKFAQVRARKWSTAVI
ncbi:hypothetical protein K474DRAFT_1775070 [Panus rudis PR-1116 ss-1]|nr:hypothetical protein K474DRAFT_1775070 [Panus rudis PR-1116 ss-1]